MGRSFSVVLRERYYSFFLPENAVNYFSVGVGQVQDFCRLVTREAVFRDHEEKLEAHIIRNVDLRLTRFALLDFGSC